MQNAITYFYIQQLFKEKNICVYLFIYVRICCSRFDLTRSQFQQNSSLRSPSYRVQIMSFSFYNTVHQPCSTIYRFQSFLKHYRDIEFRFFLNLQLSIVSIRIYARNSHKDLPRLGSIAHFLTPLASWLMFPTYIYIYIFSKKNFESHQNSTNILLHKLCSFFLFYLFIF